MADRKTACYLCTGCGIGERLDPDRLETIATRDGKMAACRQHEMLCSTGGVQMIRDDIANFGVSHLMIAACSRRAKVEAFNFPEAAVTRANLREGVIWARPEGDEHRETTQEMADDYIRMSAAELRMMNKSSPSGEQGLNRRILVVGGGVTGMYAALEAAKAGYEVHLVEKSDALGGHAATLYKRVPFKAAPAGMANTTRAALPEAEDPGVDTLIRKINETRNIQVHS